MTGGRLDAWDITVTPVLNGDGITGLRQYLQSVNGIQRPPAGMSGVRCALLTTGWRYGLSRSNVAHGDLKLQSVHLDRPMKVETIAVLSSVQP